MDKTAVRQSGISPSLKRATLLPLIGITYCMVAGGPFGLEDLIKDSGYGMAILLLLVTPLVWCFPVTLMVSELSTALPQDGGYYVWVRRAMGPFWGFQEAWLSIAASIFDMALYPTLFISYLSRFWPAANPGSWTAILVGIGLIILCVGFNLTGIRLVGEGSVGLSLALLLPFAVVVALAMFIHPSMAASTQPAGGAVKSTLLGGLLVVMWNYAGWDNTSTIAGEVHHPQRTYPRAMFISVLLVAATYVIPVAAAARSGIDPQEWENGTWVNVGKAFGDVVSPRLGTVLAIAIIAGGMISAFSVFNSLILSYSRLPVAMANDGFLPKAMGWRSKTTGVPWVAILVCAVCWAFCINLGFEKLLLLDVFLYGLSLILEFAALVALRLSEPNLERPYKVPGGIAGCIAVSIPPLAIMGIAFYQALSDESAKKGLKIGFATVVAGVIVYFIAIWINPRASEPARAELNIEPIVVEDERNETNRQSQ